MSDEKPMPEKPADCTCKWPEVRFRNGSGHSGGCVVHVRFLEKRRHKETRDA